MSKTYLHITTDGTVTPFDITPDTPEYTQLQARVGGDIEGVAIPLDSHMLYVNDTGLIDGLPLNMLASVIAGQSLKGDVVVVGPVDDEGDNAGVSEAWLDWGKDQRG